MHTHIYLKCLQLADFSKNHTQAETDAPTNLHTHTDIHTSTSSSIL